MGPVRVEAPGSVAEVASVLGSASAAGETVRPRGGGTKLGWGSPAPDEGVELSTERLTGIVEHNAGDLTAVVRAGTPLAELEAILAESGQMLALDPPEWSSGLTNPRSHRRTTVGGIVATGDSGPLRHRYGGPRDLLLGMTVALADGTVARSGGKVIKNVAGYDLAKLFAGSFGTLGVILEVAVRLHPRAPATMTAAGRSDDPAVLQTALMALAAAPLELDSLDISWSGSEGRLLARCAGAAPEPRARRAAGLMEGKGLQPDVIDDDDPVWAVQREGQRADGPGDLVVKVSARPTDLGRVLRVASDLGGALVGRAGLGLSWVRVPGSGDGGPGALADVVSALREEMAPRPCVVLDAPVEVRRAVDVWGVAESPALRLMREVKRQFDPAGVCNPGVFVGGI